MYSSDDHNLEIAFVLDGSWWHPTITATADTYAYLKVTEADGQVAITAPIWVDIP